MTHIWSNEREVTHLFDHKRFMHAIGSIQREHERFHQITPGLGVFDPESPDGHHRWAILEDAFSDVMDAERKDEGLRDALVRLAAKTVAWIEGIDEGVNRKAREDASRRHWEMVRSL